MDLDQLLHFASAPARLSDAQLTETIDGLLSEAERVQRAPDDPSLRSVATVATLGAAVQDCNAERKSRRGAAITASAVGPRGSGGLSQIERMAAQNGMTTRSPNGQPLGSSASVTITAAQSMPKIPAGSVLTSKHQLGELMGETLRKMDGGRRGGQYRDQRDIAFVQWELPEERRLTSDAESNSRKIEAVCGLEANRFRMSPEGTPLVATGGICLPVNVDYSVPTWSTADQPLRDGLPAFQADRGGLRFVTPPDIGVPPAAGTASGIGLSTGLWPEATDLNPAGATKPVYVVPCGSEQLVYVGAVTSRLQFGNMEARFAPEQLAANTQQAIAVAAREAELTLLSQIAGYTKQVPLSGYLGAARDILSGIDLMRGKYAQPHRIPRSATLTAIYPEWTMDLIKADLLREIGHDNAGPRDILAVTDEQVNDLFAKRNINVIWTIDGLPAGTYGTGGTAITSQEWSVATAGSAPQWPGQVSNEAFQVMGLLYVEGTFQFLDGGRLDLGVVRDSLLDSTNDFEVFTEEFIGIAYRGIDAFQLQHTVMPSGGSAGTVSSSSYHE
jgi:hypothetical protein